MCCGRSRYLWSQPGPQESTRAAKQQHLSTWVALDRVDRENGCLHMVPRSHTDGVVLLRATYSPGDIRIRLERFGQNISQIRAVLMQYL